MYYSSTVQQCCCQIPSPFEYYNAVSKITRQMCTWPFQQPVMSKILLLPTDDDKKLSLKNSENHDRNLRPDPQLTLTSRVLLRELHLLISTRDQVLSITTKQCQRTSSNNKECLCGGGKNSIVKAQAVQLIVFCNYYLTVYQDIKAGRLFQKLIKVGLLPIASENLRCHLQNANWVTFQKLCLRDSLWRALN